VGRNRHEKEVDINFQEHGQLWPGQPMGRSGRLHFMDVFGVKWCYIKQMFVRGCAIGFVGSKAGGRCSPNNNRMA